MNKTGFGGAVNLNSALKGAVIQSLHNEGPPAFLQGNAILDGPHPPLPKGSLLIPDYIQGHQPAYLS